MLCRAKADLDKGVAVVGSWEEVCGALDNKQLLLAPYCEQIACEDIFKKESARCSPVAIISHYCPHPSPPSSSLPFRDEVVEVGAPSMGAKALCVPFDPPRPLAPGTLCVRPGCGAVAKSYTLFGRSY